MDNKMLIDAAHPEETRVVVVKGNRVEEFDFEAENKKQLRGNIYLAKVTRVEPSLQAAFVDYGGNRHGFLAFSEIHPDYYQIPVADRQLLLEEEAAAHKSNDEDDEPPAKPEKPRGRRRRKSAAVEATGDETVRSEPVEPPADEIPSEAETGKERTTTTSGDASSDENVETKTSDEGDPAEDNAATEAAEADAEPEEAIASETSSDDADAEALTEAESTSQEDASGKDIEAEKEAMSTDEASNKEDVKAVKTKARSTSDEEDDDAEGDSDEDEQVESVGSEDALEEVPERQSRPRAKQYKIQEVIKRRQIILVQVVKEERGNKGAALTTYLSLAGRYSVLMPNTDRGGGISRKITNQTDRKRLRTIANDLDVPIGMGVILRTAGASRTKTEIKRDFEYLMRLWENVRDLTLKSSAPTLVYEEGSLLKRSIRDLYNKDINQVLVAGDEGYREAKDFMRMLMPSHAKNVQPYKGPHPIFSSYAVEEQLDAMFSPQVTLKSGGYLVINQTEALVAIDVNSGRSTKEKSIEDTALSTNLEAAEEVARQLRLRDLAGLVVIDFIDMEEKRNNRAVERKMKECLKNDRARIQVGRISHFGLLEMSRQRLRTGVLESSMEVCSHCQGTGYVRSSSSVALYVLRAIEDYLLKGSKFNLIVRTSAATALYILNNKRGHITSLEDAFGISIALEADETVLSDYCVITRGERAEAPRTPPMVTPETINIDEELARDAELDAAAAANEAKQIAQDEEGEESASPRKRRRRRKRGGSDADAEQSDEVSAATEGDTEATDDDGEPKKKRRRRGRRGGRRERERQAQANGDTDSVEAEPDDVVSGKSKPAESDATDIAPSGDNESDTPVEPAETGSSANGSDVHAETEETPISVSDQDTALADDDVSKEPEPEPVIETVAEEDNDDKMLADVSVEPEAMPADEEKEDKKPARSGWWQRRSFF